MFSAPCSAYHAGAALAAMRKIISTPKLVEDLHSKTLYFRKKLAEVNWSEGLDENAKFEVYGVED